MQVPAGQKEFLPWADLIRVVATFLVVTVHVSGQITNVWGKVPESHWFIADIYGGIARICVPLFFMISGYLLLPRTESLGTFYRKRMPKVVIPFIAWVMREVFLTVPTRLKESSYALGSTRWEVVWDVVLPYTRSAVIGGVFLGLGRALGETMAVTFVLGNAHELAASLLMPGNSIAATIANEFAEADGDLYRSALILLGFVLFVVTFVVLAAARLMLRRLQKREGA